MGSNSSFPYEDSEFTKIISSKNTEDGLLFNSNQPHICIRELSTHIDAEVLGTHGLEYLGIKVGGLSKSIHACKFKDDIKKMNLKGSSSVLLRGLFLQHTLSIGDALEMGKISMPNEKIMWNLMNQLLEIGRSMEAGFEFHPKIYPKTIGVSQEGDIMITNPYMYQDYALKTIKDRLPFLIENPKMIHGKRLERIRADLKELNLMNLHDIVDEYMTQLADCLRKCALSVLFLSVGRLNSKFCLKGVEDKDETAFALEEYQAFYSESAYDFMRNIIVKQPEIKKPLLIFSDISLPVDMNNYNFWFPSLTKTEFHENVERKYMDQIADREMSLRKSRRLGDLTQVSNLSHVNNLSHLNNSNYGPNQSQYVHNDRTYIGMNDNNNLSSNTGRRPPANAPYQQNSHLGFDNRQSIPLDNHNNTLKLSNINNNGQVYDTDRYWNNNTGDRQGAQDSMVGVINMVQPNNRGSMKHSVMEADNQTTDGKPLLSQFMRRK